MAGKNKSKRGGSGRVAKQNKEWSIVGKTVLITGANTGIGKATALELARRGAKRIIMTCRNVKQGEEAAAEIREEAKNKSPTKNVSVVVRHLDLSSLEAVRKFARQTIASEKVLHVLINNAGILPTNKEKAVSVDGNELTFATNHLGHFLLTNLLLDLLKKSAPSRIVTLSTHWFLLWMCRPGFHVDDPNFEQPGSYSPSAAYNQSKLANVLFTRELHKRLQASGAKNVTTYVVHPGVVGTDITRGFNFIYRFFFPFFVKSPQTGASSSVYCATEPGIEDLSSCYFMDSTLCNPGYVGCDDERAEKLWQLSEELVAKRKQQKEENEKL